MNKNIAYRVNFKVVLLHNCFQVQSKEARILIKKMHKFNVYQVTESCFEDSEYVTMSKVMCPRNLIESELFIKVLKKKTDEYFSLLSETSSSLLSSADCCMKSSNTEISKKGFQCLNKIIYRVPCNTTAFVDAILARSLHSIRNQRYSFACKDLLYYESVDSRMKTTDGIVLSQSLLCLALYMTRDNQAAKNILTKLKDMIDRLPSTVKTSEIASFWSVLQKYEKEINQETRNVQFIRKPVFNTYVPFNGFKCSKIIPFASSACEYSKILNGPVDSAGVFARVSIPKEKIILVENPVYIQFSAPFLNCEMCGVHQELLYTCSRCRYKTYCTQACMESDCEVHQTECYGYKIGLIPMLEITQLFRCFLQAAKYLNQAILELSLDGRIISDPLVAWNFILHYANEDDKGDSVIIEFLATQPDYKLLTSEKYHEVISTAFRLSVFIFNDTNIIQTYFSVLPINKISMIKLIAAVLMRLSAHVLLKSQQDDLHYPQVETTNSHEDDDSVLPVMSDRASANAISYYGINVPSDFVDCYNEVRKRALSNEMLTKARNQFQLYKPYDSPMSGYTIRLLHLSLTHDQIKSAENLFSAEILNSKKTKKILDNMNTSKRCQLVTKIATYFHQFLEDYFAQADNYYSCYQKKSTLCSTLKAFKQSNTTGNIKVISLSRGQFLGVASTDIVPGEELILSPYMLRPLTQSRVLNQPYSHAFKLASEGASDAMAGLQQEILELFSTPTTKCAQPYAENDSFCQQHISFILEIEKKMLSLESSQLDIKVQHRLAILHGTYNSFAALHFEAGNGQLLRGGLKFAKFLAANVNSLEVDICLDEAGICRSIFSIIRKIIEKYIENMDACVDVNREYPNMLLASCFSIVERQQRTFESQLEDEDAFSLYMEYSAHYYRWKTIINAYILMPPRLKKYLLDLEA
ncbi:uncharacterized protein LOC111071109 isoform X2 [Drosophila obscura]|uniref:uncharacterized protein LOC111071109 isoform X2 n=1 Tax=Drosophila obscura TaxID=7282 RepID=UPI001BB209D9|nr:uncharacterized protein LOC111071109 isoform X2 [Drosophila obscura]